MHVLTEKQYTWIALNARAQRKAWKDCEQLVVTKVGITLHESTHQVNHDSNQMSDSR